MTNKQRKKRERRFASLGMIYLFVELCAFQWKEHGIRKTTFQRSAERKTGGEAEVERLNQLDTVRTEEIQQLRQEMEELKSGIKAKDKSKAKDADAAAAAAQSQKKLGAPTVHGTSEVGSPLNSIKETGDTEDEESSNAREQRAPNDNEEEVLYILCRAICAWV
ncbi:hypothetical protein RFI_22354 [Reticulomyxa filosa]|uniref:Uncharacterized protein n=1 Tax=Reticulomyxa filosa TaxID=46433 RepID=X6MNK7_RETFI|nr:hypothetical protein RFI_22354 [Reticulomyxa filosa]|eukprot:ETO15012.1 hypothetical protein RFI_22354 [Reticulomyxa filosa]